MLHNRKIIALCLTRIGERKKSEFVKYLNEYACNNGYRLLVYNSISDMFWQYSGAEGDKAVYNLIDFSVVDALVVHSEDFYSEDIAINLMNRASKAGVPSVLVGVESDDTCCVFSDGKGSFEQLIRHVVEDHGINDICFLNGIKGEIRSNNKLNIFKKVLQDNNIPFDGNKVFYGRYSAGVSVSIVESLIAKNEVPGAFICANDAMAVSVVDVLVRNGYKVPEDVIVTGYGGEEIARCNNPSITTCEVRQKEIAETVMNIFLGIDTGNVKKIMPVKSVFTRRGSCGCKCDIVSGNAGSAMAAYQDRFDRYRGEERLLHERSDFIFDCESVDDIASFLSQCKLHNLSIALNTDCFDPTINPFTYKRAEAYDSNMWYVYKYGSDENFKPFRFNRSDIIPNIEEYFDKKIPLVFNGISSSDTPLGFMAIFSKPDYDNYCRIQQYVISLNNTLGKFRLYNNVNNMMESLRHLSEMDYMTGLYNRTGFYKKLDGLIDEAIEEGKGLIVASIDLNGLKTINDKYGHNEGDYAIMTVASAVMSVDCCRLICCRYGGDEIVLCAISDDEREIDVITGSIVRYINNINGKNEKPYKISASYGMKLYDSIGFDFEKAYAECDEIMYYMKKKFKEKEKKNENN